MSLSFVNNLQAQVEKLEKEILEAEAVGRDSGGDRSALSHLRDLGIERAALRFLDGDPQELT